MLSVDKIKNIPDSPGVYIFKNALGKILYIGKATSLKSRVRSYFSRDILATRGPLIQKLIIEISDIDYKKTDSVLEALILEANLIKKYLPYFNTKEKDNKSWNYVVITREKFPKVLLKRGREIVMGSRDIKRATKGDITRDINEFDRQYKKVFGPFPHGLALQEAFKLVRKIFPFRDEKCTPAEEQKKSLPRPCFSRQIGLCPGVCTGEVNVEEYKKTIRNITLFFEGKMRALVGTLTKEMNEYAKLHQFEKAGAVKRTIFSLKHIRDVTLIKREVERNGGNLDSAGKEIVEEVFRIEAYDIAHLAGGSTVGAMTVVENGEAQKSEYRRFKIRGYKKANGKSTKGADDVGNLREVLTRRLTHPEWPMPQLIVIDGGLAQRRAAEQIIAGQGIPTPVVSVVKDEKHKPRDILGDPELIKKYKNSILIANAEAHRFAMSYHKVRRRKNFL